MKKLFVFLLLAALLLTAGCGAAPAQATPQAQTQTQAETEAETPAGGDAVSLEDAAEGDLLADFAFTDMDGNARTLSELRGAPVLVTMWATWCGYCMEEMPAFAQLKDAYGDGLTVLALDVDLSEQEDAARYAAESGYDFLFAMDTEGAGSFLAGIPYSFVVGADGTLLYTQSGSVGGRTYEVFDAVIAPAAG